MSAIVLHCGCGRTYDRAGWRKLYFCGVNDMGAGDRLELRNCVCGSTRAAELGLDVSVCVECGEHLGAGATKLVGDGSGVHCHACAVRVGLVLVFPPPRGVYRATAGGAGMY